MVKFLLESGAKPDLVDKYRKTPLDHAKLTKNFHITQLLQKA